MTYKVIKQTGWNTPEHKDRCISTHPDYDSAMACLVNLADDIANAIQKNRKRTSVRSYFSDGQLRIRVADTKNIQATFWVEKA